MYRIQTLLCVVMLLLAFTGASTVSAYDATGFYRVEQIDGVWWFIDPDGERFYSVGVTDCGGYHMIFAPPGSNNHDQQWAAAENAEPNPDVWVERLREWGFTNAGAWKGNWNDRFPCTPCPSFWRQASQNWFGPEIPKHPEYGVIDVYSDEFAQWCDEWAARIVAPQANNPQIIGWFVDNEVHLPADEAFQRQFYDVAISAIRKYDTNHLLLGMRHEHPNRSDMELLIEADYFDVVSFNQYGLVPDLELMDRMYELTGKPLLIGEFGIASKEHSRQVFFIHDGTLLPTAADRAVGYEIYASAAAARPYMVGATYYRFPNWNTHDFGLTDWEGEPYWDFVNKLGPINRRLQQIHATGTLAKIFPDDYAEYRMAFNDRPHFDDRSTYYAEENRLWQPALRYWECTPGTNLLTYRRHRDSDWASVSGGFLEYQFTLEQPMPDAHIYVRYSGFPSVAMKSMRVTVNGHSAGVHHFVVTEAGSIKPEGFANAYGAFRYTMREVPLGIDLPAGETTVRFEVDDETGLWAPRAGLILHGFFITAGEQPITTDDHGPVR